ncbi:hypothetical protein EV363DRAFT_1151157, partial [Boletus edulis]
QFNPATSILRASSGLLVPVRRPSNRDRREPSPSGPRALPPFQIPEPRHQEAAIMRVKHQLRRVNGSAWSSFKASPSVPEDDYRRPFGHFFADIRRVLGKRIAQETLVMSSKAWILAAKVGSRRFRTTG